MSNMEYRMYLVKNANKILNNNNGLFCNSTFVDNHKINNLNKNTPMIFKSILDPPLKNSSDLKLNFLNNYLNEATKISHTFTLK